MAPVLTVTRDELEEQRAAILKRIGLTTEQYSERARLNILSGTEWDVREELDAIAFLLGEDADSE